MLNTKSLPTKTIVQKLYNFGINSVNKLTFRTVGSIKPSLTDLIPNNSNTFFTESILIKTLATKSFTSTSAFTYYVPFLITSIFTLPIFLGFYENYKIQQIKTQNLKLHHTAKKKNTFSKKKLQKKFQQFLIKWYSIFQNWLQNWLITFRRKWRAVLFYLLIKFIQIVMWILNLFRWILMAPIWWYILFLEWCFFHLCMVLTCLLVAITPELWPLWLAYMGLMLIIAIDNFNYTLSFLFPVVFSLIYMIIISTPHWANFFLKLEYEITSFVLIYFIRAFNQNLFNPIDTQLHGWLNISIYMFTISLMYYLRHTDSYTIGLLVGSLLYIMFFEIYPLTLNKCFNFFKQNTFFIIKTFGQLLITFIFWLIIWDLNAYIDLGIFSSYVVLLRDPFVAQVILKQLYTYLQQVWTAYKNSKNVKVWNQQLTHIIWDAMRLISAACMGAAILLIAVIRLKLKLFQDFSPYILTIDGPAIPDPLSRTGENSIFQVGLNFYSYLHDILWQLIASCLRIICIPFFLLQILIMTSLSAPELKIGHLMYYDRFNWFNLELGLRTFEQLLLKILPEQDLSSLTPPREFNIALKKEIFKDTFVGFLNQYMARWIAVNHILASSMGAACVIAHILTEIQIALLGIKNIFRLVANKKAKYISDETLITPILYLYDQIVQIYINHIFKKLQTGELKMVLQSRHLLALLAEIAQPLKTLGYDVNKILTPKVVKWLSSNNSTKDSSVLYNTILTQFADYNTGLVRGEAIDPFESTAEAAELTSKALVKSGTIFPINNLRFRDQDMLYNTKDLINAIFNKVIIKHFPDIDRILERMRNEGNDDFKNNNSDV